MNLSSLRLITRLEATVWWTGAALIAALHGVLLANVDALWRDEISSVLLARAPSWSALWQGLVTDSFPALWVALLRLWSGLGFGAGDAWLRSIGLILSIAAVAAFWLTARLTRTSLPVLALALAVFNPAVFYWGDSLRAYALAMLFIVLFFGAVWRVCEEASVPRLLWATGAAVLAAQANYQNSYLILSVCVGGAIVCTARALWMRAGLILAIGGVAALSLIPYRATIQRYTDGGKVLRMPDAGLPMFWTHFCEAFEGVRPVLIPALCLLVAFTVCLPVYFRFSQQPRNARSDRFLASLYAALVVTVGAITLFLFAKAAGFPTQSWYYIPYLGVVAAAVELACSGLMHHVGWRTARLALGVLLISASLPALWKQAHIRRTNMDLAAQIVARDATARDLVLINPFWQCIAFEYHYRGVAPWSLLPVVQDEKRPLSYGAVIPLMTAARPLDDTFRRIEGTLRGGGRVWFVGGVALLPNNMQPPPWHPAPHPQFGWQNWAFMQIWSMQTGYFMQQHAVRGETIPVKANKPVSRFEDAQAIFVFEGWRGA